MKKINLILAIAVLLSSLSCKREYDSPPIQELPVGNIWTISDLKTLRDTLGTPYTFTEDISVYATATTDETSGNFYKEVYVQDDSNAIQLRLANSGGIYEGDYVRIYLKGTTIDIYRGMYQLDGVDVDNNIIKQATGQHVTPTLRTIATINPVADRGLLIQLDSVEFSASCSEPTWSNSITQTDVNHNLVDCSLNSIIVRTSGYANFADEIVPALNGTFIGIVGIYTSSTDTSQWTLADLQLYIREPSEIDFSNTRCNEIPYLYKNFDDEDITSCGWTTQLVTGTLDWTIGSFGGKTYANMTNYDGSTNELNETWLISPSIDLSGSTAPAFSFNNAYSYSGPAIETLVSTDYDGLSDPNTANWVPAPAFLSTGFFTWVNSTEINMGAYKVNNVYVAFKYTGSAFDGSTWEIDDIIIKEI